jgi:hypothetical protein
LKPPNYTRKRKERLIHIIKCGWCGKEIKGELIKMDIDMRTIGTSYDEEGVELLPSSELGFCCNGCAWAFGVEVYRMIGMPVKHIRNHLIEKYKLVHPPGKPAGAMRHDCLIYVIAEGIASAFETSK